MATVPTQKAKGEMKTVRSIAEGTSHQQKIGSASSPNKAGHPAPAAMKKVVKEAEC